MTALADLFDLIAPKSLRISYDVDTRAWDVEATTKHRHDFLARSDNLHRAILSAIDSLKAKSA